MGGGAAMRAAAKVAGISAFTNTFRVTGTETPAMVAARKAARPVFADQGGLKIEQEVQRPVWELDEWELAGDDEIGNVIVGDNNKQLPRLVFGPPPTFEESQEATSELKHALEQVYLSSPNSTDSVGSPKSAGSVGSVSTLHETKACITHETSTSKGAMQAFQLLKENPVAQTVVASIASDPTVWNAVMQNPTLLEFLNSDRKYTGLETQEPFKSSFVAEAVAEDSYSSNSFIHSADDGEESGKPDYFCTFIQDVKSTVVDMIGRLTGFVESLFAVPHGEKATTSDPPKAFIAGGSFMALAIMVIMVVLMKRN